jgi:hypothetical protein
VRLLLTEPSAWLPPGADVGHAERLEVVGVVVDDQVVYRNPT